MCVCGVCVCVWCVFVCVCVCGALDSGLWTLLFTLDTLDFRLLILDFELGFNLFNCEILSLVFEVWNLDFGLWFFHYLLLGFLIWNVFCCCKCALIHVAQAVFSNTSLQKLTERLLLNMWHHVLCPLLTAGAHCFW